MIAHINIRVNMRVDSLHFSMQVGLVHSHASLLVNEHTS